jgi:glycosyltransferase involved in cell wall biosynthesis
VSRRLAAAPLVTRPSVSVCIPCYNYGHYLPGAVESVLSQPGVDVDIVIIDDCSPDGSAAVGEALAAADPRIRFVAHPQNKGHIATYNEGIAMAEGDYFVLLSADDLLTPGCLARAVALMEHEPSVGMVYGHPLEFVDEPPPASSDVRNWTVWPGLEWIEARCRRGNNCIFCPEVVMRGSVQHAIGGYNTESPHAGDLEMWLRAAAHADIGRVNGANQAFYRVHQQSMQRTVFAGMLTDLEQRRGAFETVLLDPSFGRGDGAALYRSACRALADTALDHVLRIIDEHDAPGDATADANDPTPLAVERERIDDYLAFAARVHPESLHSRRWGAIERRRHHADRNAWDRVAVSGRTVARDLNQRVRWRRWRWSGV